MLEQNAQGGVEVPIRRSVQEKTGCGTECSGLGDKVGIGHRLDSIISEVFSDLVDFVIPQCIPWITLLLLPKSRCSVAGGNSHNKLSSSCESVPL